MADKKSALLTSLEAIPPVQTLPPQSGNIKLAWGFLTTDTIHADADVLRLFRVNARWTFVGSRVATADIGGATSDLDLGLYRRDDGAVLDQDCFADGLDIATALDTGFVAAAAGAASAETVETMFELGGSAAGTGNDWYDVAATIDTLATDAAGLVLAQVWYIDPAA
ncbi:MAG: hypothetical protein V3V08_23290 [Nannocystaceae bacterium]